MVLTLAEARARAAVVSDVSYEVLLDLTAVEDFTSRTVVRFAVSAPETFIELADARQLEVTVDGRRVEPSYDGDRIGLTGLATGRPVELVVEARLSYVTDGSGMHVYTDPVDGERYVSSYCGMNIAHRVLACFDQNDLKAPVTLTVRTDPAWTVLANGEVAEVQVVDGVLTTVFARTPPLPVALFVVCAGPWVSFRWQRAGRTLGWHARASLAEELARDIDELRGTTEGCFEQYAAMFEEPYAFGSYDQVFVPGLNWGAMENPGCVTFADWLLPRGRITATERAHRAMVIAHEMAHMWFGDLVTMRWWEDTWLQESFADYMGFRVSAAISGVSTQAAFEVEQKPWGYADDGRASSHPVAPLPEDVPDVNTAFANFDQISYAKGNAVIRQLVVWLGDEAFLAGVNAYLTRHRFGNATLTDLVDALDGVTERNVRNWVERWLRTTGFDTLLTTRSDDGVPVLTRLGSRPHRITVTAYDRGRDGSLAPADTATIDLAGDPIPLPRFAGRVVIPDPAGDTFARQRLDEESWSAVTAAISRLPEEQTRAVLWASIFDQLRCGDIDADGFLAVLGSHLPGEPSATIVTAVLRHTYRVVLPDHVPADQSTAAVHQVATACAAGLAGQPEEELALALTRGLAWSHPDTDELGCWLTSHRTSHGVDLDPALRWTVLHRLAELGAQIEERIAAEAKRDPAGAEDGAATAMAARPTLSAKAAAWAAISQNTNISNRAFRAHANGLWSPEQSSLIAPYVEAYLRHGAELARTRGQAFQSVVGHSFPRVELTPAHHDLLREQLTGEVPTVLRRLWNDRLEDLTGSPPHRADPKPVAGSRNYAP